MTVSSSNVKSGVPPTNDSSSTYIVTEHVEPSSSAAFHGREYATANAPDRRRVPQPNVRHFMDAKRESAATTHTPTSTPAAAAATAA